MRLFPVFAILLLISVVGSARLGLAPSASASIAGPRRLTELERSELRFKLESLWNEVYLLIRNAHSEQLDLARQQRELRGFGVLSKIPVATPRNTSAQALSRSLRQALAPFKLSLEGVRIIGQSPPDKPIPTSLYTDTPDFSLTDDQVAERLRLEITLAGTKGQLQQWMDHWNDASAESPFLEWDPLAMTAFPEKLAPGRWKLHTQEYLFRDIRYPKLIPRKPEQLLPAWARRDPELFSSQEPLLWSYIEKTHALVPKALPGLELRRQFLLDSARVSFFIEKFRGRIRAGS